MKLCHRIRLSIEKEAIATPAGPVNVTVSVGLVQSDPKSADRDHLIGAADAALYRAKKKGRNCIEIGKLGGPA